MRTKELLRKEVKHSIDNASEKALRMVKAILEIEQEEDEDEEENLEDLDWDELPEALKLSIERGIKDGEEGRVTPHEEVVAKFYPQWFEK